MKKALVAALAALAPIGAQLAASSPAYAATCSQFSNQAAAQQAANTVDADGDGIYCESLPCPCLKPGSSTPPPAATTDPQPTPKTKAKKSYRGVVTAVVDGDTIKVRTSSRK